MKKAFVWVIAAFVGIAAGILMPLTWFYLQSARDLLRGAGFGEGGSAVVVPFLCAGTIFVLQYLFQAFRTADSFTYFFSELHYSDGRRSLGASIVHGISAFLLLLGGGVVGLEAVVFESVSAIGSRVAEALRLPGIAIRTITACAMAAALAAMLEMPTPAIFFVVEILLGWSALAAFIGPLALTSILAAGVSSSITGPVGYLHLLGGADGGLALALRGASVELGALPSLYALGAVAVVASLLAAFTIWLYHHTDNVLQALFSYRSAGMEMVYLSNGVRLLVWAVLTGLVLYHYPIAAGTGISLLQEAMWDKVGLLPTLSTLALRLLLGMLAYCALGSMGMVLPSLAFGAFLGVILAGLTQAWIGASAVHMALLTMGAYFSALFGTPIAATALVFSLAGGTSSENIVFLISVVGANFAAHALTSIFQKDRLATQGLYRHEIRFRNGMCFNTLSSITVRDAMLSTVEPISKHSSISAAYNSLMDSKFLKLPVVDREKNLAGILSLADFYSLVAWKNLEQSSQVHELLGIEDIMKPASVRVDTKMSLEAALVIMGDEDIVPVVEPKRETFVGILLKSDVMNLYNKEVVKKASGRGKLYR